MDTCNASSSSTEQETEKSVKIPMEKTVYVSSRPTLHGFKLPGPGWNTRKVLQCVQTRPDVKKFQVSKPCLRVKQSTRQRTGVGRREGLCSMSLSREEILEDFVRATGRVPQGKKKVKKTFTDAKQKQNYLDYLQYLKELNPGNWLSEIYHV